MTWKTLCAVPALALLTSCGTIGAGEDAACLAFRPIYVSKADALTDETAAQILAHDKTGAKLCGWKPSR